MKRMKDKGSTHGIREVYEWASLLAVENRDSKDMAKYYYWTEPVTQLLLRLIYLKRGLVYLTGLQGTGKTSALLIAKAVLKFKGHKVKMWRWASGVSWEYFNKRIEDSRYIFFDLPDYSTKSSRSMMKHMNEISTLWYVSSSKDIVFVVAAQKELLKGHYMIGKTSTIELPPLKPHQLIEAYKIRFESTKPFTEETLLLIARLSRGVFRRFLKYIQLCIEEKQLTGTPNIDTNLVKKTITIEQLTKDMDLELSAILKNQEKKILAVKILNLLREEGEMNQKTIAKKLDISQSTLGRQLKTLETHNYIKRRRGTKKERLVQLT